MDMDDTFLRAVSALQANLKLLDSQQGALSDFQDMQALRRLKADLADYIAGHASKGELPPDPLATVALRLEALKRFFQEAESASRRLLDWRADWLKGIPHLNLEDLQHARTELAELERKLPGIQETLRGMLDPRDWDMTGSQPFLHPELMICAETMPHLVPASAKSCAALQGFSHGTGKRHEQVRNHLSKISKRIDELLRLHDDHRSKVAETENHLAKEDFRSAEEVMGALGKGRFADIVYFKAESGLKKQMALFERFAALDSTIDQRLAKGEFKAVRSELEGLAHEEFKPNSELVAETSGLVARMEGVLASYLRRRKRRRMIIATVIVLLIASGAALTNYWIQEDKRARQIEADAQAKAERKAAEAKAAREAAEAKAEREAAEAKAKAEREDAEAKAAREEGEAQAAREAAQAKAKAEREAKEAQARDAAMATAKREAADATARVEQANNQEKLTIKEQEKLANDGDAYAQALTGVRLYYGPFSVLSEKAILDSKKKGRNLIEQAASSGHPLGLVAKEMLVRDLKMSATSDDSAKTTFKSAVANGLILDLDHKGPIWLGYAALAYSRGWGTDEDQEKAFLLYQKAADGGNLEAMKELGIALQLGLGTKKDEAKGFEWLQSAGVTSDYGPALYYVGLCYLNGVGCTKDIGAAIEFMRRGAENQNWIGAQLELAKYYYINRRFDQCFKLWRRAAEQGSVPGMFNLGVVYMEGRGTKKNAEEALRLWRIAAAQGHQEAKERLAKLGKQNSQ